MNQFYDNGITRSFIKPIKIECEDYILKECFVFSYNNRHLLLQREFGTIIIIDDDLLEDIKFNKIDENLFIKLIQRRFIVKADNESNICVPKISPTFFLIDITSRCNLNCTYCFRNNTESNTIISDNILNDICQFIIKNCLQNKIYHIDIQPWGGEPLLAINKIKHIHEIFTASGIDFHLSLETNGLLLNDKMINLLNSMNISIGVSIDGPSFLHDAQRPIKNGHSSLHLIEKNITNLLLSKRIKHINSICVLTPQSLDYIDDILQYFAKTINISRIKLNYVHQSNFNSNLDINFTEQQIIKSIKSICYSIKKLYNEGLIIYEGNIIQRLKNLLLRDNGNICLSHGCNGGYKMVSFDRYGNIYPCELLDYSDEKIGNIYQSTSLNDIIADAVIKNEYFIPKKNEECDICPWWYFCGGGCTSSVKYSGKHPPQIDYMQCTINKFIYPELIKMCLGEPKLVNTLLEMDIL